MRPCPCFLKILTAAEDHNICNEWVALGFFEGKAKSMCYIREFNSDMPECELRQCCKPL